MVGFDDIVADVATQLRRRQLQGSLPCAKKTAVLMRALISTHRLPDAQAYIDRVKEVATQLQTAKPMELAISNMARRVLHIIREEANDRVAHEMVPQQQSEQVEEQSSAPEVKGMLAMALRPQCRNMTLANLLDSTHLGISAASPESTGIPAPPSAPPAAAPVAPPAGALAGAPASVTDVLSDGHTDGGEGGPLEGGKKRHRNRPVWDKRQEVIEALNELITELDFMEGNIAEQAVEHIHANEVILTLGWDNTVALFLRQAAKKRKFQVVVAEAACDFGGHRLARELADAGLQVTVIADAAVFAMMARINKVLVGAHALLANGSIMGGSGLGVAAMAAKRHAVPFVVLAGLYKLSPLFPHQPDVAFNDFTSPAETMDPEIPGLALEGDVGPGGRSSYVHVPTPVLDYVPPEMISLFVTDTGGYTPSYVYRLLAEFYSRDDYILSKELLNHITRS